MAVHAAGSYENRGANYTVELQNTRRDEGQNAEIMDQLWSPWRFAYVTTADGPPRPGVPARLNAWPGDLSCVFCNLLASVDYAVEHGMSADEAEEAAGLVKRGKHCFICLNAYPYTSGHVMVMPYAHLDRIAKLDAETAHELMDLV